MARFTEARYVVGFDVGGTKVAAGLVDSAGRIVARRRFATAAQDPERLVAQLAEAARDLGIEVDGKVAAVGVAIPGQIDWRKGVCIRAANLALKNFPLGDHLRAATYWPVAVENDTNAAALAEWRHGAGEGHADFVFVAIGTGIGAGAILDGRLIHGSSGNAAEVGHTVVHRDGPLCPCGSRGCVETLASGGALTRVARRIAAEHPDSRLGRRAAEGHPVNATDLFEAAESGEEISEAAVDDATRYLAVSFNNLFELFDPSLLAVGGGMAQVGEPLFRRLKRFLKEQRPGSPDVTGRIVPAVLGEDAGILGAAAATMTGEE
ncbi:MAG TPA: ROK family protein [Chloroflexota bacterium]|nr:ROK family protein [Chloroflexota bacterium]